MFKKGPDIDKKKLLLKAFDVKKDSATRLKHFKTLINHLDNNEVPLLFASHFEFIYDTFIDAFSTIDCNFMQNREDLDCILFMLKKILIHDPNLIRKRSFGDLLRTFVVNSSHAFTTQAQTQPMLDEQVEICKRIMNIYRYMVMKIFMNTATWEQLLNVMLNITERIFPPIPPERKGTTLGSRIAPAFFQTFIVSWIRANLYVHIAQPMWKEFHRVMKNLVQWRELVEEWSNTMNSLTRVLVKHVYGLNLSDLPLDKPQDRRRRSRVIKSFSTIDDKNDTSRQPASLLDKTLDKNEQTPRSNSIQADGTVCKPLVRGLTRALSDGVLYHPETKAQSICSSVENLRRIRSEYLILKTVIPSDQFDTSSSLRSDVIDDTHARGHNMIMDQIIEPHPGHDKSAPEASRKSDSKSNSDKCVLLGGSVRGWTPENSIIMWRRMLGLFGNINDIEDPYSHLVAIKCIATFLADFIRTRDNLGISLDNQSTPALPNLLPPYTYATHWLLEATLLPKEYKESSLLAYRLLCFTSIRRHDIEPPEQYYVAFYEALHRGLMTDDILIHTSIIESVTQLLSLELPGCTLLVQDLFEISRSLLFTPKEFIDRALPRCQAIQILSSILSLYKPIKKLLVLKYETSDDPTLISTGDLRSKILNTFFTYTGRSVNVDCLTKSRCLCSTSMHIYQELVHKSEGVEIDKLFKSILNEIQNVSNSTQVRINCDLLRLFADHAHKIMQHWPNLASSAIQTLCQLIVRLNSLEENKEAIDCILLCLEDWCIALGKNYLLEPVSLIGADDIRGRSESLMTVVLSSLEAVINDEHPTIDTKAQETHSNSEISHELAAPSDAGSSNNKVWKSTDQNDNINAIKLACKVTHQKLITYIGHFPFKQVGAASMVCCVDESDFAWIKPEAQFELNNATNMSIFVVDRTTIITFVGAPGNQHNPGCVHMLVRNLCGKYSWDISHLDLSGDNNSDSTKEDDFIYVDPDLFQQDHGSASMKYESDFNEDGNSSSSLSSRSSAYRFLVGDLLNQLSSSGFNGSSMSSSQSLHKRRNSVYSVSNPRHRIAQAEETMIALLSNQRFQELNYCDTSNYMDRVMLRFGPKPHGCIAQTQPRLAQDDKLEGGLTFEHCRQLIHQLGYLSWKKRFKVDMLNKTSRLLRELKNLDAQTGRETHKIAVLYVANGQEDKNSILTNQSGSRAFEEFIAGLGWEVNLSSHLGFRGGLQSNKNNGETSPYYCNGTTEVMFHVSTRIPITGPIDEESLNKKLRHLGNDEIHIVWSEHTRDYRRGIIPTEFGDVIIAIHPMLTFQGYFRIQIFCKQDVPLFGPLFDNSIVHQTSLPALVRATAINASRAKRLNMPYYQPHFEQRARLIDMIVQNHKDDVSFEDMAARLYQFGATKDPLQSEVVASNRKESSLV